MPMQGAEVRRLWRGGNLSAVSSSRNQREVAMITLWIGVADDAGWVGRAHRGLADEIVETVRDTPLAFLRGVLVDQCRPCARVAEAGHELLRRGSGMGGQGPCGMAKIVKTKTVEAHSLRRLGPLPLAEVRPVESRSGRTGEHVGVGPTRRERWTVGGELGDEDGGEGDDPLPRSGFRVVLYHLSRG